MLRQFLPSRDDAQSKPNAEVICDLDMIISPDVTFTYGGRSRALLPITLERILAYVKASQEHNANKYTDADDWNRAYLGILHTVCDDVTLEDVRAMTLVQRANLLEHIARKISGQPNLIDSVKKKVAEVPSRLAPLILSPKLV